jgi:hypothetical protein
MIEAFVFSALIFTAAGILLSAAVQFWLHLLPMIRQYRIVKRETR